MKILFLMGNPRIKSKNTKGTVFLTEFQGKILLEHQIEKCEAINPDEYIFTVPEASISDYKFDLIIKQIISNYKILGLKNPTAGSICTALLGIDYFNGDEEIIILAADEFINVNYLDIVNYFRHENAECGIVNFSSIHPRYSYMLDDPSGKIIEIAEKNPLSKNALASFYYFNKSSYFIEAAMKVIKKDRKILDSFYISQAVNEMILEGKKIINYNIESESFIPLKTKSQIKKQ
jgi:NDP-sugar pyrophosphorylase family protein